MKLTEQWLQNNKLQIYFSRGSYARPGDFTISRVTTQKVTECFRRSAFGLRATALDIFSCIVRESLDAQQSYKDLVSEGLFEEDSQKGYNTYQLMKKNADTFNKIISEEKDLDGNKPTTIEKLMEYLEKDKLL